jgi:pyruvate,water dikinase
MSANKAIQHVKWFEDLGVTDVPEVGGKNASLGEMISRMKKEGIPVPNGFATTAKAYWEFVDHNGIRDKIKTLLGDLDDEEKSLEKVGRKIRRLFVEGEFPKKMAEEITNAYKDLGDRYKTIEVDVAVRSSATAEDLPTASFAGQQETFLNVTGGQELLDAVRKCYASLFTDRAISYRIDKGFDHMKVALSAGIQKMVRSDLAGSGVMFSIDTETGFPKVVVINAAWGLGENVVQGSVNPDEYVVFKPFLEVKDLVPIIEKNVGAKERKLIYTTGGSKTTKNVQTSRKERMSFVLNDDEIMQLSRWAMLIEKHYKKPMDMEWAKDGQSGDLFIVQARPETVQSQKEASVFQTYELKEKGEEIIEGLAIGDAIATGKAQVIKDVHEIDRFKDGSILVTGMTDPDWVPIMTKASGIITDHGGRTSHAAIVSRELGVPAVVGTAHATEVLKDDEEITLSCAEGDIGYIYKGKLKFDKEKVDLEGLPETRTQIMMNIASPDAVLRWWRLPNRGIGLARMEFIINNIIKIHPMALVKFDSLKDKDARRKIEELTKGYEDKTEYFVDHLARGIAKIGASQYPDPVIVRMSDFKTNEYANLVGGKEFEPEEDNPMLGFRGASRYYSDRYRDGFALECRAIKRVRDEMGFTNVVVMIPFCRTLDEADKVIEEMKKNGIKRGENGLEIYLMAEIPSNVILAEDFAERVDGFSIGSNDLTQLVLGVDRDSEALASIFDERNKAVEKMIKMLIESAKKTHTKVGICGQGPSDYPDFAEFLVRTGIDSISLNPDSVVGTIKHVAEVESKMGATVASK